MHMCMSCALASAISEATMLVDALVNAICAPEAKPGIPNGKGQGNTVHPYQTHYHSLVKCEMMLQSVIFWSTLVVHQVRLREMEFQIQHFKNR